MLQCQPANIKGGNKDTEDYAHNLSFRARQFLMVSLPAWSVIKINVMFCARLGQKTSSKSIETIAL